jgi:hypothetical protein
MRAYDPTTLNHAASASQGFGAGSGKKRLCALAEWVFGGGAEYCEGCEATCETCPQILNQPQSFEGWQVWDLVTRLGGQLRVAPGGGVIGWDMGAALALAEALGICRMSTAELLPAIEAGMVRKINEQMDQNNG